MIFQSCDKTSQGQSMALEAGGAPVVMEPSTLVEQMIQGTEGVWLHSKTTETTEMRWPGKPGDKWLWMMINEKGPKAVWKAEGDGSKC